jgi:hypothetical protein
MPDMARSSASQDERKLRTGGNLISTSGFVSPTKADQRTQVFVSVARGVARGVSTMSLEGGERLVCSGATDTPASARRGNVLIGS